MIYATRVIAFIGLLALATSLPLSEGEEPDVGLPSLVVITSPTRGDRGSMVDGLFPDVFQTFEPRQRTLESVELVSITVG
ncbi:hypothetical protein EV363DRAFT_1326562 [Boletus edulis]|uniref:Uncharacterized protein n=1 Tax=Boletus edulis BED1 TaxID=1328754 RepID=A0AAD4BGJ3_BOLED|nr:hypothetical protein EV363DRAFT_1326562 [Boletus edulis]KAF8428513.1 hypothetical protein L210DRAFT_3564205 [Boletus edulis BED1]